MKKEYLLIEIVKSSKPLIGLVKEEKFYHFKAKSSELKARYKIIKIRSLLTRAEYEKYLKFEKKAKINLFRFYKKNDRFIIFLHYVLKYGRRIIHRKTGISERYIREFIKSLKK